MLRRRMVAAARHCCITGLCRCCQPTQGNGVYTPLLHACRLRSRVCSGEDPHVWLPACTSCIIGRASELTRPRRLTSVVLQGGTEWFVLTCMGPKVTGSEEPLARDPTDNVHAAACTLDVVYVQTYVACRVRAPRYIYCRCHPL